MKLGQILLKRRWISPIDLENAIDLQTSHRQKLGELLIGRGVIANDQLEQALQEQYWRKNGFWVID